MNNNPLISICVITYNSEKTVIETLESAKAQTYDNVELIITDDCSLDETVSIVENWIEVNGNKFHRAILVKSEHNTGISANMNRGYKACKGTWIKVIDGDDMLYPNAIEEFVYFIQNHHECKAVACKQMPFGEDLNEVEKCIKYDEELNKNFELTQKEKFIKCLEKISFPGNTMFIQHSLINEIGGHNEKYPFSDEWSFQLKLLEITDFYFIDKYLVHYRCSIGALSHGDKLNRHTIDNWRFYHDHVRKLIIKKHKYLLLIRKEIDYFWFKHNYNYYKNRVKTLLSPIYWYKKILLHFKNDR